MWFELEENETTTAPFQAHQQFLEKKLGSTSSKSQKNAGSSFCRSFKQADMCRMDLNENGNGNAQSVNMLNCSPIANENIEQHLDDHVL